MEAYAKALTFAIPGFFLLIIIEWLVSKIKGYPVNRGMDTISSLSSGMTNTLKEFMGLSVIIISYSWMVSYLAIFEIKSTLLVYVVAFIGLDFANYWSHRFNHVVNVFWNRHIVHHSSEEFNLSCALRQNVSAIIGVYFFLYIPIALIGIPAIVVAVVAPIHLFAQFWYHTRLIGKMGILEQIIVTPSHHRVHHAINPEYIDKNYAAIFIFWDKLFGTFQPELDHITPVYGVKRQVKTWNPIIINYQHMWLLIQDCWRTKNYWDKIRLWFMPTGWRPPDVAKQFPVEIVSDVFNMKKYHTDGSGVLFYWSWFQLIMHNLLMYYILVRIAEFNFFHVLLYALFLMISIFAYTSLMDRSFISVPFEIVKFAFGLFLFQMMGGWFGLDDWITGGSILISVYLGISLTATLYFQYFERKEPIMTRTHQ